MTDLPSIIAELRREPWPAVDEYVRNRLRGHADRDGLEWRARFVTALREANLWPQAARE